MTLKDALWEGPVFGYGRQYFFRYKGESYQNVSSLISIVVERYSTMYGKITAERANDLYKRLADKYCVNNGKASIVKSLMHCNTHNQDGSPIYAHPKSERTKQLNIDYDRQIVRLATNNPDGDYAYLPQESDWCCCYCGVSLLYRIHINGLRCTKEVSSYIKNKNTYLSVCRSPMCKAMVDTFPEISRSRTIFPVAKILMELSKNGDRQAKFNEITKRTAEHAKAAFTGRHRQERGSVSCSVGN